ncbi:zinc finger protein neuro-d4-like [Panonychus citri]|uniref:zinc finger protein neuro-d4-like n=1 Tax=Panonychus citri TaxID=50023 RepID=UPI002306FB83|nr:zinc finger protein neuro-d4-like [Panonychus citri]
MGDTKINNLRPHVLQKIEKALSDISYRNAIENSAKYNNRLVVDRKTRLPFIDSQTGVAQRDCYLWMQRWQRMPGTTYGQLYTYPAHKWKKRRRGYLFRENYYSRSQAINENSGDIQEISKGNGSEMISMKNDLTTTTSTTGTSMAGGATGGVTGGGTTTSTSELNQNSSDKFVENSKDAWMYAEYEDSIDLMEEDFDDPVSDGDDYDEYSTKRKKRRSRRKKGESGENDKPYACDLCDARYKTRPGLTYHFTHIHLNEGEKRSKNSTPVDEDDHRPSTRHSKQTNGSSNGKSLAPPNPYCDFCLVDENEKSKVQEKMISCSDCGRSAHPSCLQFTPQMIISVAKYRWQCIECKSCGFCGTSDNDEQLLFCDDCDRGYHMYCLKPPIKEPPEGTWICVLCVKYCQQPKNESQNANEKLSEKGKMREKEDTRESDNSGRNNFSGEDKTNDLTKESQMDDDEDDTDDDKSDSIEEKLKVIFNRASKK